MSRTRAWALALLLLVPFSPLRAEDAEPPWGEATTETTYINGDKVETTTRTRGTDPLEREIVAKTFRASYSYNPTGPYGGYIVRWTQYRTSTTTTAEGTLVRRSRQEMDQPGPNGRKETYESFRQVTPGARATLVTNARFEIDVYGPDGGTVLNQLMASNCSFVGAHSGGLVLDSPWATFGNVRWSVTRSDPRAPAANGTDQYMRVTTYTGGLIDRMDIFSSIGGVQHLFVLDDGEAALDNFIVAPDQLLATTTRMLTDEQRSLPWMAWNTSFLPSDWWYLLRVLVPQRA